MQIWFDILSDYMHVVIHSTCLFIFKNTEENDVFRFSEF